MLTDELIKKYRIKDMSDWKGVGADLIITDPPFGIEFSGKRGNYNRKAENVVEGYVEWSSEEYVEKVQGMLRAIKINLKKTGQALVFSGWNNSNIIHNVAQEFRGLDLRGKLYWSYNFAPACKKRPAHNVYEIFWLTRSDRWTYNPRCTTLHCSQGEPNLSTLFFKRDYHTNMPKYPTRLPLGLLQCLLEHFSNKNDLVFDPLAGSGMVGVAAFLNSRDFLLGDLNPNGKLVFRALLEHYGKSI